MSEYVGLFEDAIKELGLKKALTELLYAGKVIDKSSVGQVVAHMNRGSITAIFANLKAG
ncbi:MAG TPA: hypothetical protein ACFYD4_13605 [Candidatus Wunengus sp. YC61]|uniref:hypothetical protein n=1 Tax=Candidatus Wunengus sp. YC61 TaxID=3367698 RepID=UPI004026D443